MTDGVFDVAELNRRERTYQGWIPPRLVRLLDETGHRDRILAEAVRGDWFCADHVARALPGEGRRDEAVAVLAPYVEMGWWTAVATLADILATSGESAQAIDLVAAYAGAGDRYAVRKLAELLAGQDRVDEAIGVLRPAIEDWFLAETLVRVTAGRGRDAEVTAILETLLADRDRRPWNAGTLLAQVLERRGEVAQAVAVLRHHLHDDDSLSMNVVGALADLLGRHGRWEEARALVAGRGGERVAFRLARLLEARGEVDDAVALMHPFVLEGSVNAAVLTGELLHRHGRVDEAIEVIRPVAKSGDDMARYLLGTLLCGWRSPAEALAVIDDVSPSGEVIPFDLLLARCWVLQDAGRTDEAVALVHDHPEAETWAAREAVAGLLTNAGRLDEAIAVLDPSHGSRLAELLIRRGRVDEAVAILHRPPAGEAFEDPWAG